MPARKMLKGRRKAGVKRRGARRARPGRSLGAPRPIFTETFRLKFGNPPLNPGYNMNSNAGGTLSVAISDVPQITNYSSLYSKYRILKATFICLPQFVTESSDVNAAQYNQTQGAGAWGMSRIVTAVHTTPGGGANPGAESDLLQYNNCKIHTGKPKITLSCRPVPDLLDANGNQVTNRRQFINFSGDADGEIEHHGIKWWHTLPNPGGNVTDVPYFVYCRLTFQLADSR